LKYIAAWFYCRNGATAVEYGLLAGGISLTIVATAILFGSDLRGVFTTLDSAFATGVSSTVAAGG
jgi:Flp pilus assembly pilin Flp